MTDEDTLLGVAYPEGHWPDDEPEETCSCCGELIDDFGRCDCDDEPWHDEDA